MAFMPLVLAVVLLLDTHAAWAAPRAPGAGSSAAAPATSTATTPARDAPTAVTDEGSGLGGVGAAEMPASTPGVQTGSNAAVPAIEQELIAEVRERVLAASGRESYQFVPATTLSQGEVVYYTVRIRNRAAAPASAVTVVQRVPANTSYIAGSAAGPGAQITFSIDGGRSFATPERLIVTVEGKAQQAVAGQYTHIRWQLRNPLAPGAVALARFRAVFE